MKKESCLASSRSAAVFFNEVTGIRLLSDHADKESAIRSRKTGNIESACGGLSRIRADSIVQVVVPVDKIVGVKDAI
ncbi:MAG: hypothetical protein ABF391_14720 [Akkermansiaceae bacterium]